MLKTIRQIYHEENLQLNEAAQWGTDKFSKHPYAKLYDELFSSYRNKNINLLEIGAYHGASTIIWDKYFLNANITVLDIEPRNALKNIEGRVDPNRTKIIINDAYDPKVVEKLPMFDIINDDGPHTLDSQIKCIDLYYNKLNDNGIMVIEDVSNIDWFDIFINHIPQNTKYEKYNLSSRGVSDSNVFVIWK